MTDTTWRKLDVGTMEHNHGLLATYRVIKALTQISRGSAGAGELLVTTYHAYRLVDTPRYSGLWFLGSGDTFKEAKAIVQQDIDAKLYE